MTQVEFDRVGEASTYICDFLESRLPNGGLSSKDRLSLAGDLTSIWAESVKTVRPGLGSGAHIASLRWVIRDDDLKLLDSILDGLKASAGAGFFILAGRTVTGSTVAAVSILAAFLKLAYNALTKGAILSPRDYSVIATLFNETNGLTEKEILDRLLSSEPNWTAEQVTECVVKLTRLPSGSGKVTLVWKSDDDGRWRVTGV
jgi:hypothetical protein